MYSSRFDPTPAEVGSSTSLLLQPGDVLYLPRGYAHCAKTIKITVENNNQDYTSPPTIPPATPPVIPPASPPATSPEIDSEAKPDKNGSVFGASLHLSVVSF